MCFMCPKNLAHSECITCTVSVQLQIQLHHWHNRQPNFISVQHDSFRIFNLVCRTADSKCRESSALVCSLTLWPLSCLFHLFLFWPFIFSTMSSMKQELFGFLTCRPRSYGSSEHLLSCFLKQINSRNDVQS